VSRSVIEVGLEQLRELELPAKDRAQILRLLAKDPGGVSERGELSRVLDRLRVDVDTLAALVGAGEEDR
jgi:hypothetical protein